MTSALTAYLRKHEGFWHVTSAETPIESPLAFLLAHAAEQQNISSRTNAEQIRDAVTGEN